MEDKEGMTLYSDQVQEINMWLGGSRDCRHRRGRRSFSAAKPGEGKSEGWRRWGAVDRRQAGLLHQVAARSEPTLSTAASVEREGAGRH